MSCFFRLLLYNTPLDVPARDVTKHEHTGGIVMFARELAHTGGSLSGTPSVARLSLQGPLQSASQTLEQVPEVVRAMAPSIPEDFAVAVVLSPLTALESEVILSAPETIREPLVASTSALVPSADVGAPPQDTTTTTTTVSDIATMVQAQVPYLGYDVHSYTEVFRSQLPSILTHLPRDKVTLQELDHLIDTMMLWYGPKPAFLNIRQSYDLETCMIADPHLPGLDSAIVLRQLCNHLHAQQNPSLFHHFGETLDDIGMTCRQGITHRLLVDYLAFF